MTVASIFMQQDSHDISTLNSLIATTIDSADGYAEAAKDSESGRFAAIFNERSAERRSVMTMLQTEVTRLGAEPEDDGTMLAGAHRMFVNLKSVVTGKDDKAIIYEVERGEDHIKGKFEDAMANSELSATVLAVIRECYASVRSGHDQMRDIKHAMENGRQFVRSGRGV